MAILHYANQRVVLSRTAAGMLATIHLPAATACHQSALLDQVIGQIFADFSRLVIIVGSWEAPTSGEES